MKGEESGEEESGEEDASALYPDICLIRLIKEIESLGKGQDRMQQELSAIHEELRSKAVSPEVRFDRADSANTGDADLARHEVVALRRDLSAIRDQLLKLNGGAAPPPAKIRASRLASDGGFSDDVTVRRVSCVEKEVSLHPSTPADNLLEDRAETVGAFRDSIPLPPSLPSTWPSSVERRKMTPLTPGVSERGSLTYAADRSKLAAKTGVVDDEDGEGYELDYAPGKNTTKGWGLNPNGFFSLAYSLSTLAFLAHDSFMVPWTLAWELPYEGVILTLAWASCLFWTADMLLGFCMGYHHNQKIETRLRHTFWHYARSWFLIDFCVVLVDWFGVMTAVTSSSETQGSATRMFRVAKVGKLVRLMSLLRMTKVVRIFEEFVDSSLSDPFRLSARLVQFLFGILWMCHLICCSWFAVGRVEADTGMNWTATFLIQGDVTLPYMQAGLLYQYVTALHWSFAQFSLGATEISCYNSFERIFNMFCILVGLIGGSMLVSSLSATMVDYQMIRKEHTNKLAKLRRYLRENRSNVSKATALAVQQQAVEKLKVKERLHEKDVMVLSLVSSSLRMELRFEIYRPMLHSHGLFQLWLALDPRGVQKLCLEALVYTQITAHDELFLPNSITGQAHHLASGSLDYIKDPETAPVEDVEVIAVKPGTWLAEPSLWSCWVHVGTAQAKTACEVLTVDATAVDMMMQTQPEVHHVTVHYAKMYHRGITSSVPPRFEYPDDLQVSSADFDEIFMSLNPSVLRRISLQIVSRAWGGKVGGKVQSLAKLKKEISSGKSCVLMNMDGSIQRMVSVVVMRLEDHMGRILVNIGKAAAGCTVFSSCCQLPGNKQEQGETSMEALGRIATKIGVDIDTVELLGVERTVQTKFSSEVGMNTKYLRKVHRATLPADRDLDMKEFSVLATKPPKSKSVATLLRSPTVALRQRRQSVRRASFGLEDGSAFTGMGDETGNVYVDKRTDGQSSLYAWLSQDAFDFLGSPDGEQDLKDWLDQLNGYAAEPIDL